VIAAARGRSRIPAIVLAVLALGIGAAWQIVAEGTRVAVLDFRLDSACAVP
jgi:hypothetical protein